MVECIDKGVLAETIVARTGVINDIDIADDALKKEIS